MNRTPFIFYLSIFLFLGCDSFQQETSPTQPSDSLSYGKEAARVKLEPRSGSKVSGHLRFYEKDGIIVLRGEIRGLNPNGEHGFHIHEKGDCSADDASSAGGHFSIGDQKHGHLHDEESHAGDLGNISADASGLAIVNKQSKKLCIDPSKACSVLGRSVITHAQKDDLVSQPSGAAGARIACGVITKAD